MLRGPHVGPTRTMTRTASLLAALGAASALVACESTAGSRPHYAALRARSRATVEEAERLSVDESTRAPSPLAVVASTNDGESSDPGGGDAPAAPLTLEAVLDSVDARFPLILAAQEEVEIALGELVSARGGFDTTLKANGDANLQGFYENERFGASLEQPTGLLGATFFGGYKRGTGDFAIWNGDLKTNEGGEFRAGATVPLLQGREIDERRLALWRARVNQEQADPLIETRRLQSTLEAATAYWKWVSAGLKLRVAERLLDLAETRQTKIEQSVEEGEFPPILIPDNRRLVVARRSKVRSAERDVQRAAIELSLFLRAEDGAPRLPRLAELPSGLPVAPEPGELLIEGDAERAAQLRPELRVFDLELEKQNLERMRAENDFLPRLDLSAVASDDFGDAVSTPDDKGPYEFGAFVEFEVPLQRREAGGRIRTLEAEIRQLQRELGFAEDRVRAEVRDARSELVQTWQRISLEQQNLELNAEVEAAERDSFLLGESNIIRVNIREQDTAAAAERLIEITARYFRALAAYRAAIGVPYE